MPIILFLVYKALKLLKKVNEVQFRINSKGIQYKNEELVPWNNIENERVDTKFYGRSSTDFFIYYIIEPSQVMQFDLNELNTDASELSIALTIHRNRFKKENNIQ